ncbi:MAG: hypothetical protein A2173_03430 [Planctomycetes bacterium RBG_13_44_8b]|nr:MAG: hypothetical protein A2173_03430 [Planctomycetes bacterium RBG_13_44_8b]
MPTLSPAKELKITREKLAYWFFRLNGCFTFENFIVHPNRRGPQRTEVDIITLRFRHRQELVTSNHSMEDYPLFQGQEKYASVFFVEVKKNECSLNGPWLDTKKENIERVLNAIGLIPKNDIKAVSEQLYNNYIFDKDNISISFAMVGKTKSSKHNYENIPQLTWNEILHWMYLRYVNYEEQKADHQQWDPVGIELYKLATKQYRNNQNEFVGHCLRKAGISDC